MVDVGLQLPVTGLALVTVRLVGQLGLRPEEGEVVIVIVTVPVKPPVGVMVMVEDPAEPELKSAGEVTVIEKSEAVLEIVSFPNLSSKPVAGLLV